MSVNTTPATARTAIEQSWPATRSQTASGSLRPARRRRINDNPARGRGRAYLVERQLELDGNAALWALIEDYIAQSAVLNAIPMASSPLERYLEKLR